MAEQNDDFTKRSKEVRDDAQVLMDDIKAAARDLSERIDVQGRIERNPYGTLLAAAGVGYILGGGLFTRATGRILGVAARLMLVPLVRAELSALGATLMGAGEEETK